MRADSFITPSAPAAVQAYSKPPALVELTLSGVMTVLRRPATWEEAKKALGDANFMMRLLSYDKDGIDDALLKKINKLTSSPDFTPDAVGKVSLAARGMCMWVRAMAVYGTVAKDVGPKRTRLKAAQDNLSRKQAALSSARENLATVLAQVKVLRERWVRDPQRVLVRLRCSREAAQLSIQSSEPKWQRERSFSAGMRRAPGEGSC